MRPERREITLIIDGREVEAAEGTMLVDAAKHGDVEIPVFCYEPKLGAPVGACRMCLVEIEGMPKLQTACSTPVRDGMVVYTQTDQVQEAQNAVVEFLLVNHPLDCPVCDKGGECPLQDIALGWGPGRSRFTDPKRHFRKPLELSPLVAIDRERCILCYRCVRFSQEVAEDEQLQLLERGDRTFVGTFDERPYVAPFHGNITELCPVGALTSYTYRFRARPWDIEQAGSVCTLCPSQCNVSFTVRDDRVKRVVARDNPDVDDGWLCDKGRYGFEMLESEARIESPSVRSGGSHSPAAWPEAIERAVAGLREGGTAAALVGDASNEEGYLVQRILREALGSPHVDSRIAGGPSRAEAIALSRPALSAAVADIDHADAILVIGAEPMHAAPILDLRIRKAVRRNGARLAVATERPSALDGGAAASARYAPGGGRGLHLRAGRGGLRRWRGGRRGGRDRARPRRRRGRGRDLGGADRPRRRGRRGGRGAARPGRCAWRRGPRGVRPAGGPRGHQRAGASRGRMPSRRGPRAGGDGLRHGRRADPRGARVRRAALPAALRRRPDPRLPGLRGLAPRPRQRRLRRLLLPAGKRDDLPRRRGAAAREPRREGGNRHTSRRAPAARPPQRRAPGRHPPRLAGPRRARGRAWATKPGISSAPDALAAVADAVPFYAGITEDEIGGRGIRWQDRDAASALRDGAGEAGAGASPPDTQRGAPGGSNGSGEASRGVASGGERAGGRLTLGTYRDIWAGPVTEHNPPLRFLEPKQRVEIAPGDAERLGVSDGDLVTVSENGTSVEARVAVRERMREGAVFLIEGTREGNANALLNGGVAAVEVARVEAAEARK